MWVSASATPATQNFDVDSAFCKQRVYIIFCIENIFYGVYLFVHCDILLIVCQKLRYSPYCLSKTGLKLSVGKKFVSDLGFSGVYFVAADDVEVRFRLTVSTLQSFLTFH